MRPTRKHVVRAHEEMEDCWYDRCDCPPAGEGPTRERIKGLLEYHHSVQGASRLNCYASCGPWPCDVFELATLALEADTLRTALEQLEWSGFDEMESPICSACDAPAAFQNHRPDCFLAAALGGTS